MPQTPTTNREWFAAQRPGIPDRRPSRRERLDVRRATAATMTPLQVSARRRNGTRTLLLLLVSLVLLAGAQAFGGTDHGAWRDLVSLLGLLVSARLLVWLSLGERPPLRP